MLYVTKNDIFFKGQTRPWQILNPTLPTEEWTAKDPWKDSPNMQINPAKARATSRIGFIMQKGGVNFKQSRITRNRTWYALTSA
jgi:hypothetical protein